MLDPRRLAVLRAFAAEQTIAGAAGVLSFTPSAVSQQLSQLQREAEVSLPLLARGGLDLVIAEEYDHAPRAHVSGVHREALAPDELLLALPPAHPAAATEPPVALAALAGDSWAPPREGTAYAAEVARICRSAGGFEPQVRHRVNDLGLLLA